MKTTVRVYKVDGSAGVGNKAKPWVAHVMGYWDEDGVERSWAQLWDCYATREEAEAAAERCVSKCRES